MIFVVGQCTKTDADPIEPKAVRPRAGQEWIRADHKTRWQARSRTTPCFFVVSRLIAGMSHKVFDRQFAERVSLQLRRIRQPGRFRPKRPSAAAVRASTVGVNAA